MTFSSTPPSASECRAQSLSFTSASSGVGAARTAGSEVSHLVTVVQDQIAVGVADRFPAAAVRAETADDGSDLADRRHRLGTAAPSRDGGGRSSARREVAHDVIPDQLLNPPVLRSWVETTTSEYFCTNSALGANIRRPPFPGRCE